MTLFRNTTPVRVNGVDHDIGHIIRAETAYWRQWPDIPEICLRAEFYEQYARMRAEPPRYQVCRPRGGAPRREAWRTYLLRGRQVTGKVRLSDILCAPSAGVCQGAESRPESGACGVAEAGAGS
jgi:hypothetical protein